MKNFFWLAMLVVGVVLTNIASAHHSFAMFNRSKVITVTGTVKQLQWGAPHVLLWVVEDPKAGEAGGTMWTIELSTGPGPLARLGWTKYTVAPGERVAVEMHPLHNNEPGGSFMKLTILKTGQAFATGAPPADMDDLPSAPAAYTPSPGSR